METLDQKIEDAPAEATPASNALVFLEPGSFALRWEGNRVQIQQDGAGEWREISLARLFPFSEPDKWISILDKEGKEIGVIRELKGVERENLALLHRELDRRYLVPTIRRILKLKHLRGIIKMAVETNRGPRVFFLRNLNECVQQPLPGYLTLSDVDGNRYDIPDIAALDTESRKLLDVCL